jgi:hypothetical protein
VVLGDEGRAGWSADGVEWNFVPLPGSASVPVAAVWAADRGEFLAVGTSGDPESMRVWRSADGATWGSRLAGGCRTPVGLVRGAGNYVAAMADGWIWYSPDGSLRAADRSKTCLSLETYVCELGPVFARRCAQC